MKNFTKREFPSISSSSERGEKKKYRFIQKKIVKNENKREKKGEKRSVKFTSGSRRM